MKYILIHTKKIILIQQGNNPHPHMNDEAININQNTETFETQNLSFSTDRI